MKSATSTSACEVIAAVERELALHRRLVEAREAGDLSLEEAVLEEMRFAARLRRAALEGWAGRPARRLTLRRTVEALPEPAASRLAGLRREFGEVLVSLGSRLTEMSRRAARPA